MVESPCIGICKYDEDFICRGCKRSRDEIQRWLTSTDEEKKLILDNVEKRRLESDNNYDRYV